MADRAPKPLDHSIHERSRGHVPFSLALVVPRRPQLQRSRQISEQQDQRGNHADRGEQPEFLNRQNVTRRQRQQPQAGCHGRQRAWFPANSQCAFRSAGQPLGLDRVLVIVDDVHGARYAQDINQRRHRHQDRIDRTARPPHDGKADYGTKSAHDEDHQGYIDTAKAQPGKRDAQHNGQSDEPHERDLPFLVDGNVVDSGSAQANFRRVMGGLRGQQPIERGR